MFLPASEAVAESLKFCKMGGSAGNKLELSKPET